MCYSGKRSAKAAEYLKKQGYMHVVYITFGYDEYVQSQEGLVSEDKMIIQFVEPNVNAWLIVKDKSRKDIEEYISYAYALFDNIVPESGESNVKVIVDANVQEYWPEELIEKYSTDDNTKGDL